MIAFGNHCPATSSQSFSGHGTSYYDFHINFDFGVIFPIRISQVIQIEPLLFGFNLRQVCQLTRVFHHNVILHQNSLGHNCRHLQAIEVTLWSLEQPFLGPCNHLSEFIPRPCLLPSSAFCTIQSILFLNYSTSNYVTYIHHQWNFTSSDSQGIIGLLPWV